MLPSGVQATSVRLLVNIVEVLIGRRQPDMADFTRLVVQRMLYTFVDRLERLKQCLPHYLSIGTNPGAALGLDSDPTFLLLLSFYFLARARAYACGYVRA